jgi:hypothetical protein
MPLARMRERNMSNCGWTFLRYKNWVTKEKTLVWQSDWHDRDLVRGFGGCRQGHGGWKYGKVSAVEREVIGYATYQDEGEEHIKLWVDILEVQELGDEGKGLLGLAEQLARWGSRKWLRGLLAEVWRLEVRGG